MSATGVVSGANQAAKAMDRLGDQARKTSSDLSLIKNIAIGVVVAKGIGMAADAFMSAARAAGSYAAHVAQGVDAMNDLAQRTGIGVESLQALQMAAKLSGIDDVTGAVQKLGLEIGQAAESGKTEAFTKLGLDFQQLQAMAPEEQFKAIQAAIAALPTPAERAAAAVSIFGKAGVELLPLMNQNLAEVEERMRRLGAIVGDDQVEAIGGMNDALDMVKATFDGIIGQVVGNLAPVVESLANDLLAFVEEFNNIGGEGGGIADTISNALLDVADYFAGIFDNAVAQFEGFSVTMETVGSIFETAGNVFSAVGEVLRAVFNVFQLAGDALAAALGTFLQYLGSYFDKDLEAFGKGMVDAAMKSTAKNSRDLEDAASNAGKYATRAIYGGNDAEEAQSGPARRAVNRARERMNDPEARAERERAREQKQRNDKAAREAASVAAKAKKDSEDAAKAQEKAAQDAQKAAEKAAKDKERIAKDAAAVDEKMAAKQGDVDAIVAERQSALGGKSNEALKANDVRSSEGMAQFLALATGREDPAIAEYRKQTQKLDEIRGELRALQQEKVDILGAAA
jgi:hypothetical protein